MPKNVILIITFIILFSYGCTTPKYIKETPLKFNYNKDVIEQRLGLKEGISDTTDVVDHETALSDKRQYLKEKYSAKLGVMPNDIEHYALYEFIDEWLGTPFAEKGFGPEGISPAYFMQVLFNDVYKTKLSKSPLAMFKSDAIELFTGKGFLKEGDIVFLRYNKDDPISDVALYLQNDKIVTSTRERGLSIFDFDNGYFQKRYAACGRLKPKKEEK